MPRSVKVLIGPSPRLVDEALDLQVVHLVIEVERRRMAAGALRLAEEELLAAQLGSVSPSRGSSRPGQVELRRRREVEHVLHLRHVDDLDPVEDVHALLDGVDLVAVEVGGALLELGEVLDRAQAALRAVDLLVEQAAQAHRVEPEAALLRAGRPGSGGTGRWCGR